MHLLRTYFTIRDFSARFKISIRLVLHITHYVNLFIVTLYCKPRCRTPKQVRRKCLTSRPAAAWRHHGA